MMDHQHERSLRRDAAKAFFDAIEQLPETLEVVQVKKVTSVSKSESTGSSKFEKTKEKTFDLHDLEEAAADIEQYMQSLHQSPESRE